MRPALFTALVLTFSACGMNLRHSPRGPNSYLITAKEGWGDDHDDLMHAVNNRAMKLCGPAGYTIDGGAAGSDVSSDQNGNVSTEESVSLFITCKAPPQ